MKENPQDLSLLVLEKGASWPTWSSSLRLDAPNLVVEAQSDDESTVQFEERLLQRLRRIRDRGDLVHSAGYVCALDGDRPGASRLRIGEELLGLLPEDPMARLILGGGAWDTSEAEAREREKLVELWAALSEKTPRRGVSVRFDEGASESGVFALGARVTDGRDGMTGS